MLQCAVFVATVAGVVAQEALRSAAEVVAPAAAAVVEVAAAPTHLPPDWHPPTTPQAFLAFSLALLSPVILLGAMVYTKEKGGMMPGCLAACLICCLWTYLAVTFYS